MPYTSPENFPELIEAMKVAAATLRDAEIPFLLGGGLAGWARGGPPRAHAASPPPSRWGTSASRNAAAATFIASMRPANSSGVE